MTLATSIRTPQSIYLATDEPSSRPRTRSLHPPSHDFRLIPPRHARYRPGLGFCTGTATRSIPDVYSMYTSMGGFGLLIILSILLDIAIDDQSADWPYI